MSTHDLNYYLSLPYTIEVLREEDEENGQKTWFARVRELSGCMTEADSFAELGEMIRDAMTVWIADALEDGEPIPEPRPLEDYSGKFVVRVPRSLHRDLAEAAEREGVSLNSFANMALSQSVSGRSPASPSGPSEPAPRWSKLSDAAYRALIGAGLDVEARDVNEELFSRWLEGQLNQAHACLQHGDLQGARAYIEDCRYALRLPARASRLMGVFQQTVNMLDEVVERQWQLSYGPAQHDLVRQRLSEQVRQTGARSYEQTRERSEYRYERRKTSHE